VTRFPFSLRRAWLSFCLVAALLCVASAHAVTPDERLADPALEARAREISTELRCLVCQNQSIDDSSSELARDLRILVRERLVAGDSDPQVLEYLRSRYGDFVLLRPPVEPSTYVLWFGPALLLAGGAAALGLKLRRRPRAVSPVPLTEEENRRLARALEEHPAI
jgi:cytochrome c-type biogenesis protein CcmH